MSEVEAALDDYVDFDLSTKNAKTAKNHRVAIKRWLNWLDSTGKNVDNATPRTVKHWMVALSQERDANDNRVIQNQSIINYAKYLQSIYGTLETDYGVDNIFEPVDFNEVFEGENSTKEAKREADPDDDEVKYIETTDARRMLRASREPVEQIVNGVLIHTGVRLDELRNIRYEYVDTENCDIQLITSKRKGIEWRTVWYDPDSTLARVLPNWIANGRADFANSKLADKSPYLLTGRQSAEQMREEDIRKIYTNTAKRIGIQARKPESSVRKYAVTPHSARHHFGMSRAAEGMPLPVLSQLMGHSNIETTAKYYVDIDNDRLRDAENKYRPIL